MKIQQNLCYLAKRKVPEHLIYHLGSGWREASSGVVDRFVMFSTKKGESNMKATLECMKSTVNRDGLKNVPSVYVNRLMSSSSGKGFGTDLLNFVRVYSKRCGCNGYFHLYACGGYAPNRVPHVFYKKYGLNTEDATINKQLDKLVRKGKNGRYTNFNDMDMFYPPIIHPQTTWDKLMKLLGLGDK